MLVPPRQPTVGEILALAIIGDTSTRASLGELWRCLAPEQQAEVRERWAEMIDVAVLPSYRVGVDCEAL